MRSLGDLRLREVFSLFNGVAFLVERDGCLLDVRIESDATDGAQTPAQLRGLNIAALVAPDDIPQLLAMIQSVKPGRPQIISCSSPTPGGLLDGEVRLLAVDDDLVAGFVTPVAQTISAPVAQTTRHRPSIAQAALEDSERWLAEAVQLAGIGMYDQDIDTGAFHWTPELREIYGWGPEDGDSVTIEMVLERVIDEDRWLVDEATRLAMDPARDGQIDVELRIARADTGEIRWVATKAHTLFESEGGVRRPVRTVGALIDTTDRHRLEQQIVQSARLDALGRLAGGIAHDFNNLLGAILGFAEVIESNRSLPPDDLEHLKQIRLAATQAKALTSQLLSFARQDETLGSVIDLNIALRELERMLRQVLGTEIELALSLGEPSPVKVDLAQIQRVILNLVVNARDAMPNGGQLLIETSSALLQGSGATDRGVIPGRYARLTVSDTGTGIPDDQVGRIFDPFFTTKPVGSGTGLGLATVYGAVVQAGGTISVSSTLGQGTTFEVLLPCAEPSGHSA